MNGSLFCALPLAANEAELAFIPSNGNGIDLFNQLNVLAFAIANAGGTTSWQEIPNLTV
jgi:hypothetical protein